MTHSTHGRASLEEEAMGDLAAPLKEERSPMCSPMFPFCFVFASASKLQIHYAFESTSSVCCFAAAAFVYRPSKQCLLSALPLAQAHSTMELVLKKGQYKVHFPLFHCPSQQGASGPRSSQMLLSQRIADTLG